MICLPLFADQMYDSSMVLYRGTGVRLDKFNITKEAVANALREIIYNPIYNDNAKNLAKMIKNKPMSPEKRIVKYSEFAVDYDLANNLDIIGKGLHWIQFYCIDVILFLVLCILIVMAFLIVILKSLVKIGFKKVKEE